MFSERLDFLMRLTGTSNSALARAISFDPSYISKIRSGKRNPPRNNNFFERTVPYFARNLTSEYQKRAVSNAILGGQELPEDRAQLEKLLGSWLYESKTNHDDTVHRLLEGATVMTKERFAAAQLPRMDAETLPDPAAVVSAAASVFYGNEGKRQAVELFLTRLSADAKPHSLLLYSDEDMAWLHEDEVFLKKWGALLIRILSNGGSIRIIHTLSRSATELMTAVQGWMPLYLTGRVEPYYCPRLRDGIYRRSLFIARGHSVLTSSSVAAETAGMANLLFTDPAVTAAFEAEYLNYFSYCRPLMRIFRSSADINELLTEVRLLNDSEGNLYTARALPGLATMPKKVLAAMAGDHAAEWENMRARSAASLKARLASGAQAAEILNLPALSEPFRPSLPIWQMIGMPALIYDRELLADHLSESLRLMERYDNYRVVLSPQIAPNLVVTASENAGAMLFCPLPAVFSMKEQNLSSAMLEYLQRIAEQRSKKQQILALSEYIRALRG